MAGTGGIYNDALPTAADLPMEETRSREEVRVRLEAKRNKVTTPWGNRPARTDGLELRGDRAKTAQHTRPQPDEPAPPTAEQTPALADLLGRARVLVTELEAALSRLPSQGDRP